MVPRVRCVFDLSVILALLSPALSSGQYTGTASVTQGLATTTVPNLYSCPNGRVPALGTITASDATVWTVPAAVNYTDAAFPVAPDLHNACNGNTHANTAEAIAALDPGDVVTVDPDGELITAFVFADNYFELYVNGVPVGKDAVPYTQFNSSIVRFRVDRPFTVSMLLVDWEEHLGLGAESSNGFAYHDGDGGMVAVFKDDVGNIIATTGSDWKAQTFYTAPITDLTCPTENGALRLSDACSTQDVNDGSGYHALHWPRPEGWTSATFDDVDWPSASTYSNATVGVDNKPAYTNFTDIFDDATDDAEFIWSTNLILDNEVIVRHSVELASAVPDAEGPTGGLRLFPNPAQEAFRIGLPAGPGPADIQDISLFDAFGRKVLSMGTGYTTIPLGGVVPGTYSVVVTLPSGRLCKTLLVR